MSAWNQLTAAELQTLADAVRSGRFPPQPSELALVRLLGEERGLPIAQALSQWAAPHAAVADWLDLLASERQRVTQFENQVDLVWTGPELPGLHNRDTGAVMRQLFASAYQSAFLAGYALHGGEHIFRLLAERMDEKPELDVCMVLDIQREYGDERPASEHVQRFANRFRNSEWPGTRLPAVYYDPRSLELDRVQRASMHAKCLVVDREQAFVTSANFTTAAQTKNIEAGVLVRQHSFAGQLEDHFRGLIRIGTLAPLPLTSI